MNILRATALGFATVGTFTALLVATNDDNPGTQRNSLPPCELEDGSTQPVCIFHGSNNVVVINVDYGRTYYRVTQGV